jgi:hypothetical protein
VTLCGVGQLLPFGCDAWVPVRYSGTIGMSDLIASRAQPERKGPSCPVRERVPSGYIRRFQPSATSRSMRSWVACDSPDRSRGIVANASDTAKPIALRLKK